MIYLKKVSTTQPISGNIINSKNITDKEKNTYSAKAIDELIEDNSGGESDGILTDSVIGWYGDEIPEGYEEVEDINPGSGNIDISEIVDLLYPIGRGFIDYTDTDYSNWLGLTWERESVGMFPIGKNPNDTDFATVGQKGGEKEHTLTEEEMPEHTHPIGRDSAVTLQRYISGEYSAGYPFWIGGAWDQATNTVVAGGSQPHNNLPPYQVVSYWKRVDPNAKKIISFELGITSYQAEEGMTWTEWCNSNYNIDGCYVSGNYVYSSNGGLSISDVTPTSVIISGTTYIWYNPREK